MAAGVDDLMDVVDTDRAGLHAGQAGSARPEYVGRHHGARNRIIQRPAKGHRRPLHFGICGARLPVGEVPLSGLDPVGRKLHSDALAEGRSRGAGQFARGKLSLRFERQKVVALIQDEPLGGERFSRKVRRTDVLTAAAACAGVKLDYLCPEAILEGVGADGEVLGILG